VSLALHDSTTGSKSIRWPDVFSGTVNLISTLHACHRRTVGRYCLKPTFQPFFFIIGFTFIKKKKTRGNWPPQVVVEMTFGDPKDHETVR